MSTPLDPCCPTRRREPPLARALLGPTLSVTLGVLAALAPKCPVCLGVYLSVLGVGIAGASAAAPLLSPVGTALIALGASGAALKLLLHGRRRRQECSEEDRPPRRPD
jgi:hypothetical protein